MRDPRVEVSWAWPTAFASHSYRRDRGVGGSERREGERRIARGREEEERRKACAIREL